MSESVRVERHLGWVTVDGQRYPREKAADWLNAVAKGLCPFCGEGPFIVVASHVHARHGYDKREFRDLLGIPYLASISDPTHRAMRSEAMRDNHRNGKFPKPHGLAKGTKLRLSNAARRDRSQRGTKNVPLLRAHQTTAIRRGVATRKAKRDAWWKPIEAEVVRLLRETSLTHAAIAELVGAPNPNAVYLIAKANNISSRKRGTHKRPSRPLSETHKAKIRAGNLLRRQQFDAQVRALFEAETSLNEIAQELGKARRAIRESLQRQGIAYEDGRRNRPKGPPPVFRCLYCDKEFEGSWESGRRTCSDACRHARLSETARRTRANYPIVRDAKGRIVTVSRERDD